MNFGSSTNLFNHKLLLNQTLQRSKKKIFNVNKDLNFVEKERQILQIEKKLFQFQQNFLNSKKKKQFQNKLNKKVSTSSKVKEQLLDQSNFNICPSMQSFEDLEEQNKIDKKYQSTNYNKVQCKLKKIKKVTKEQKIKRKYKTFAKISKLHFEALIRETFVFIQLKFKQIQI